MTPNIRGTIAIVIAMLTYVINDSLVKLSSARFPPSEIMVIRGFFCVITATLWVYLSGVFHEILPTLKNKMIMSRAVLEGGIAFTFISALALISLPDITAITMLSPLIITGLSVPLLKKSVGWRRWTAIFCAFIGMLLVMKPTGQGLGFAGLLALASAFMIALRDIITFKAKANISSVVMMFFSNCAVFLVGLMLLPFQTWVAPNLKEIAMLAAAAIVVTIGNYFVAVAYRGVDVSLISAFRNSIIVFAMIAGYLIWGDVPDGLALIGIAIIVVSGLYMLHRENLRARMGT